jgi:hypothetical protein
MNRTATPWYYMPNAYFPIRRAAVALLILLTWCSATAVAQNASQPTQSATPFSIRATHLLGFEGAPSNANGTLSIQDGALQFQKGGRLQDVFLGEESKQVGGLPMTMGKAAVPFGGGRAVSLFSHKKYDTLTVEYVDASGGVHGAIFQLSSGQGEALKNELVAKGAHVSHGDNEPTKQSNAEVPSGSE